MLYLHAPGAALVPLTQGGRGSSGGGDDRGGSKAAQDNRAPGEPLQLGDLHVTWRGKRIFDLLLSLALAILALPLLVLIAVAVKLTSRGPVLFRQRRVGLGGQEFPILKFRTMACDAQEQLWSDPVLVAAFLEHGHKLPGHLDARVTAVGRRLRRLSLDELPQLLNVVAGHMSLVGPRPWSARNSTVTTRDTSALTSASVRGLPDSGR